MSAEERLAFSMAYMGLTLYEAVVGGMPHNRSIASSLHGIGALPANHGTKYWPLVASAGVSPSRPMICGARQRPG